MVFKNIIIAIFAVIISTSALAQTDIELNAKRSMIFCGNSDAFFAKLQEDNFVIMNVAGITKNSGEVLMSFYNGEAIIIATYAESKSEMCLVIVANEGDIYFGGNFLDTLKNKLDKDKKDKLLKEGKNG